MSTIEELIAETEKHGRVNLRRTAAELQEKMDGVKRPKWQCVLHLNVRHTHTPFNPGRAPTPESTWLREVESAQYGESPAEAIRKCLDVVEANAEQIAAYKILVG